MEFQLANTYCPECITKLDCQVNEQKVAGNLRLQVDLDCPVCGYSDHLDLDFEIDLRNELGLPGGRGPNDWKNEYLNQKRLEAMARGLIALMLAVQIPIHYGWVWFA